MPYISPYCASKAGLILFTKSLALEWAKHNIQVNARCPGYLLTDLNREFFKTTRGQKVINKIPMRRPASLEEIRGVILLLASKASSFMTGSVLVVDGGHIHLGGQSIIPGNRTSAYTGVDLYDIDAAGGEYKGHNKYGIEG